MSHRTKVVVSAAAALGLGLGACGSSPPPGYNSSSPSRYNNAANLERAISANAAKTTGDPSATARTACVADGTSNQFNCSSQVAEDGVLYGTYTATITVSTDGTTWVATNTQGSGN
jgi:hypothetical protein